MRLSPAPRKVVVLGETRLGAFLCSTPALRALREALPAAEIVMITAVALRDLVCRLSSLDRYVALPPLPFGQHAENARLLTRFFQAMQEEDFDLGIQMHGYGIQSQPFFGLLGAKVNAGFVGPADMPGVMEAAFPFPQRGHTIDRFLELTTFLGAPFCGRDTEFPLRPEDGVEAERLLASASRPLIGIHPGARSSERRWEPARFAEASASLQERTGGTVLILGGESDQPIAEHIAQGVVGCCLNLTGRTSLPVLGAVIKRLSVLLANDSGPAHIGYTVGAPTVTLFASVVKTPFFPPESGPFRPLLCASPAGQSTGHVSLNTIPVEQVRASASEIMRYS